MSCRLCSFFVCLFIFCRLCFIFFQKVHLCLWAIGGHELGTFSIRVHNSFTVYDNSWPLKVDNFSEFQNVISDSPPTPSPPPPAPPPPPPSVIMTLSVRKSIFDWPLKDFNKKRFGHFTSHKWWLGKLFF